MKVDELRIGMKVAYSRPTPQGIRESIPMEVVAIFKDGTVYLDFEGNEGDVWEVNAKDLKLVND